MTLRPCVKRWGILLWTVSLFLVLETPALPQSPETQKLADEGLDFLYNEQFEDALEAFRKIQSTEPTTFIGDFFLCFAYELYMDEYKSTLYDSVFSALADRAIKIGDKLIKTEPTAENYLYLGGSYGIRGTRKGQFGDWWGAFKDGKKAYGLLQKCIEINPGQIDAYYGIGLYHFWKSHKLRMIAWLPFISDQREEGRSQLRNAMLEGGISRVASRNALFRIYMEEKEYEPVLTLAREYGEKYTEDVFHRWFLGFALARLGRWEETLACFSEIELLLLNRAHGREADVICLYWRARALYEIKGANQESLQLVRQIRALAPQIDTRLFYYEEYIKEAEALEDKMPNVSLQ